MIKSIIVVAYFVMTFCPILISSSLANLVNNGYTGVLISIEPDVPEDANMIEKIKVMMTQASVFMLSATQQRAYFKEVTILVPKTWTQGSYEVATTEKYKLADIKIAFPNPNKKDTPYVVMFLSCGSGGNHVHLTPDYVTNDLISGQYGPRGKTIVHEWGHYRWGVFDEYPTSKDTKFYLGPKGHAEATRCSGAIEGTLKDNRNGGSCTFNSTTRLPNAYCNFHENFDQPTGLQTSVMYKQFLSQVTTFCHNNTSDLTNLHNVEALNNQNKWCNYQSTWDVIMKSDDFKNGDVNSPNSLITDTTPTFKVFRAEPKRLVFVMDVSGSMFGWKLDKLRAATTQLIMNVINNGTYVGLVSFESTAYVLAYPTQLNTKEQRKSLSNFIPSRAGGGTAIGMGIQRGILALQNGGQSSNGGNIVVITDGEENVEPYVETITQDVISSGVIVHAIFIGLNNVNQHASLVSLCDSTAGTWTNVNDTVQTGSQLNNVLASLTQNDDGDLSNELVQISSQALSVESGDTLHLSTAIDGSVGGDTTFTFTWSNQQPIIELKPPGVNCIFTNAALELGRLYCVGNPIHEVNDDFKNIIFSVPGNAQIGRWEYNITSSTNDDLTVAVVSASSGQDPITIEPFISTTSVEGNEAAVIYAKVFQKHLPVMRATVTARVVRPDGSVVTRELLDNGAGADLKKDDGVYSRSFAEFNAQGRYYVEAIVFKNGDDAEDSTVSSSLSSSSLINGSDDGYITSEVVGAEIEGVLERVASFPGLQYIGSAPTGDIFPPNRITDLSVSQVNLDKASDGVVLEFTAPGDDYDYGNASSYEIRYSQDDIFNLLNNFTDQLSVSEASLINGSLDSPKSAMSKEIFYFNITDLPDDVDSVRISFAVRAFDEVGNPSKVSNLALIRFFIKPPPIITTDDDLGVDIQLIIILASCGAIVLIAVAITIAMLCRKHRMKNDRNVPDTGHTFSNDRRI